jgi:hypothetical protein
MSFNMRSGHKLRCLLPLRLLPLRCEVKSKGAKSKAKGSQKQRERQPLLLTMLPFAFDLAPLLLTTLCFWLRNAKAKGNAKAKDAKAKGNASKEKVRPFCLKA